MKQKILILVLIISLIGNIYLAIEINKETKSQNEMQSELEETKGNLENLQTELSTIKEEVENLESEKTSLQEENNSLQSELEFLESIELLSKIMYATEDGNVYIKPDESSEIKGEIKKEEEVHVTGRTSNDWYRVEWGNGEVYIKASLLSDTKPTSSTNTSNSSSSNTSTTNNNSNSNSSTTTPSQGSSLNQENVGAILDNLFGEGTGTNGLGNGQGMGLYY